MGKRQKYQAMAQALPRPRPRAYNPEWTSSVSVPLAFSGILAGAVGILASIGVAVVQVVMSAAWPWWTSPMVGVGAAALVFAWRVWTCESDRRRLLLWPFEELTGEDLDGDRVVGDPGPARRDPRLIYVRDSRRLEREEAKDWRFFLAGVFKDGKTARRRWVGTKLPSGRELTRERFELYTGRLLRSGLAVREHEKGPLLINGDWRQALQAFAETLG